MNRSSKLRLPTTLSFVVVAAATFAGPWVACDSSTSTGGSTASGTSAGGTSAGGSTATAGGTAGSTSSSTDENAFCLPGPDAGPKQKCPDMLKPGEECPPGCEEEVV